MNRNELKKHSKPHDLIRLKHCEAVRIGDNLFTVKYGRAGDYRLYRIYGEVELL